jgi:hypothetical protein
MATSVAEIDDEIMLANIREEETPPPIPDFGEGFMALTFRRAWLIENLNGTGYVKATDMLYDSDIEGFCCIGVGAYLCGAPIDSLVDDSDMWYAEFNDKYGISMKTQKYLVSMNDGTPLRWPQRDKYGAVYNGTKTIRPELRMRSFREIARFLEIVWGLNS